MTRPVWTIDALLRDADGTVAATVDGGNVLADGWSVPERQGPLMVWSGSLADTLDEATPMNWMATGRAALDEWWRARRDAFDEARRLWIRPHCRHVLSDPPSCLSFLRDHHADPIDVVLAPGDLLEDSMLDAVEEHLERAFAALGPTAPLVIVDEARLPSAVVEKLLAEHVPATTPVALQSAP